MVASARAGRAGAVVQHEPAGRDARPQRGHRRRVGVGADPQQRDLLGLDTGGVGHEAHLVVEQPVAGERLPDRVEVRVGGTVDPERVDQPDPPVGELVRGEPAPHQDRRAARADADVDEIARHARVTRRVELRLEVVEPGPPAGGEHAGQRGRVGVRVDADLGAALEPFDDLRQHRVRVAQDRRVRAALGQVGDAGAVVDLQLVGERGLEQVEVAAHAASDHPLVVRGDALLEDRAVDADRLGQPRDLVLAGRALEVVEEPVELGLRIEQPPLCDDREPEVGRQHHQPEVLVVTRDEVVDRGHHAVAGAALLLGVVHGDVHAAAAEAGPAREHALLRVGLAELLRDRLRRVVEVTPPVGPTDVVQEAERERRARLARGPPQRLELVEDRVPVVIAVDQRGVERPDRVEHLEAQRAVEHVAAAELGPQLLGVEGRHRVDHVQLGVVGEVAQHQGGVLAAQCADLDDPAGSGRPDRRGDDGLPEGKHGGLAVG
jgi:hypothetical protein